MSSANRFVRLLDTDNSNPNERQDIDIIKAENATLKQELQRVNEEAEKLKSENSDLLLARSKEQKRFAEQIKQLTTEKTSAQEAFTAEAWMYMAAQADRTQAQAENRLFEIQAEELSSQLRESVAEREALRDELYPLQSDLSGEAYNRIREKDQHAAACCKLRDELSIRDTTIQQLAGEIEDLEDASNDLMAQTASLSNDNKHLRNSLAETTRDLSRMEKELKESKSQLHSALANGESTQAHDSHAENDVDLENKAINALHDAQTDLAATKSELEEKTTCLTEVTARLASSQTAVAATHTKFALLEQTLAETQHMLSAEQLYMTGTIQELYIAYADLDSVRASLKNEKQLHKALQTRFDNYFDRLCFWLEEVEKLDRRVKREAAKHEKSRVIAFSLYKALDLVFVASKHEFGLSQVELPPLDLDKYDDYLRVVERKFLPQQASSMDQIRSAMSSQTQVFDAEVQKGACDCPENLGVGRQADSATE